MYTIEVNFSTGNSFGSHDETDQIAHVWEDKKLARKALKSLSEHYEYYRKLNGYCRQKNEDLYKEMEQYEWYTRSTAYADYPYMRDHRCAVELDDGSWVELGVDMWCGYFENLHNAAIVSADSEEDYISF